jgi:16S rRNA (guanine966-N2)-methyltransferase
MQQRSAGKHKGSRGKSQQASDHSGQVRIIAGRWRGSRLPVADLAGLRPSGDRTRETLFNWLQPWLPGSRCLDLFAGSGVLGFEAASRGAEEVVLIDSQLRAIEAIEAVRERLKAVNTTAIHTDALTWLAGGHKPFDVIFVDPPFAADLHQRAIELIVNLGLLKPAGWLYVEVPKGTSVDVAGPLVANKEKQIGDVQLNLYRNP